MNLIDITEANLNIDEAAERIFLGPQGRLVEKIQIFNNRYGMWENDEEVIKYAPLNEAFKGSYGNFTKFEKLLIITIIIICFFLYKESKV